MSITEIAAKYGRHPVTVLLSLHDGTLHATSTYPASVSEECAAAWNEGTECPHRK